MGRKKNAKKAVDATPQIQVSTSKKSNAPAKGKREASSSKSTPSSASSPSWVVRANIAKKVNAGKLDTGYYASTPSPAKSSMGRDQYEESSNEDRYSYPAASNTIQMSWPVMLVNVATFVAIMSFTLMTLTMEPTIVVNRVSRTPQGPESQFFTEAEIIELIGNNAPVPPATLGEPSNDGNDNVGEETTGGDEEGDVTSNGGNQQPSDAGQSTGDCQSSSNVGYFIFKNPRMKSQFFVGNQVNIEWDFSDTVSDFPSVIKLYFYSAKKDFRKIGYEDIISDNIPGDQRNFWWTVPQVADGVFFMRVVGDGRDPVLAYAQNQPLPCTPEGSALPGGTQGFRIYNEKHLIFPDQVDQFGPSMNAGSALKNLKIVGGILVGGIGFVLSIFFFGL